MVVKLAGLLNSEVFFRPGAGGAALLGLRALVSVLFAESRFERGGEVVEALELGPGGRGLFFARH